jgi:hypothetical protein
VTLKLTIGEGSIGKVFCFLLIDKAPQEIAADTIALDRLGKNVDNLTKSFFVKRKILSPS